MAMNFEDPITMAMLAASAGFLDPRGGMAAGMQGAMQGLQSGNDLQRQKALDAQAAQKAQSKAELHSWLKENITPDGNGKFDIRNAGNKMIGTGHPELMSMGINLLKQAPKAKYGQVNNNGVIQNQPMFDDGTIGEAGGLPVAEKLMQIQQGNKTTLAGNMTGAPVTEYGVNMSPGESARLAQQERQFGASHGLAQQNAQFSREQAQKTAAKPIFHNGAWLTPPTANNPQGTMTTTDMYTPPKGSEAEKTRSNAKVGEILGNDTADLIKKSTGSLIGTGVDMGGRALGIATEGGKAIATLKIRTAQLAGNVPRFEGPQSNADRDYYVSMVGQLDDSTIPIAQRLESLKEVERIHKLVKPDGSINMRSGGASGSFANDDHLWGQVNTK